MQGASRNEEHEENMCRIRGGVSSRVMISIFLLLTIILCPKFGFVSSEKNEASAHDTKRDSNRHLKKKYYKYVTYDYKRRKRRRHHNRYHYKAEKHIYRNPPKVENPSTIQSPSIQTNINSNKQQLQVVNKEDNGNKMSVDSTSTNNKNNFEPMLQYKKAMTPNYMTNMEGLLPPGLMMMDEFPNNASMTKINEP